VRAPERRHAIEERQRAVGILRDIGDREVVADEGGHEAQHRGRHHHCLSGDRRAHRAHPALLRPGGARDPEERLQSREQQRENQGKLTELR